MAIGNITEEQAKTIADNASDYGSDLDEAAVADLLSQAESQPSKPAFPVVVRSIEDVVVAEPSERKQAATIRLSRSRRPPTRTFIDENGDTFEAVVWDGPVREASVEVESDEVNRRAFSPVNPDAGERQRSVPVEPEVLDTRSPLQRFRTAPKKPLSVTDIISPAWCELQYWYSLTKHGRVRSTPAMRQGSKVHKVLEEQVHKEVRVEVVSREDAFGLRLWNIIQGLRTLRATGLTRELEVWGVVDGEVVNGIIDELSFKCPDEELELKILQDIEKVKTGGKKSKPLPANQRTMDAFVTSQSSQEDDAWLGTLHPPPQTVYLVDIKTRGSKTVPASGASMRPTTYQLMMYRRLLSALASNLVPADTIFERYRLDGKAIFRDTFIAQIGSLDFNIREDADNNSEEAVFESSQDSVEELLAHKTLASLWTLMIAEFARTITINPSSSTISPLLTAEYRTPTEGSLIGKRSFAFDTEVLEDYVTDEMRWWRGEREVKGVDIEEAFKCRICEFAEGCTWRAEKIEEATRKARLRSGARRKSEI